MRVLGWIVLLATACGSLKDSLPESPPAGPDAGASDLPKADGGDDVLRPNDAGPNDGSSPCGDGCTPEVVFDGEAVTALTVDTKNVYFAIVGGLGIDDEPAVYVCPKAGCGANPLKLGRGIVGGIAVVGDNAYWGDSFLGTVYRCPVAGCTAAATAIAPDQAQAQGVWSDGLRLVWSTSANEGSIVTCDIGPSCAPSTVAQSLGAKVTSIVADRGTVVWSDADHTFSCSLPACTTPRTIGPASAANAISGGQIFSIVGATITKCTPAGCAVIASSKKPEALVVDGTSIFWRDATDRAIYRCGIDGCSSPPPAVATNLETTASSGMTTDDLYIYWATGTRVLRARKAQ